MESPKYSNRIAISRNENLNALTLNFLHEFPVVDSSSADLKTTFEREQVCGVVLTDNTARQLRDILKKYYPEGNNNE